LDRGQLERQIGRLLGQNSRAAARYSISLLEDKTTPAGIKLKWNTRPEWDDWAKLTEGTYILRSNIHDWTDEQLWKTYIQLSEAEAAFRIQKSDLCIRPIWHHKQDRIVIVYRGLEPRFCKNRLDKSYSLWYCRVDESGQAIERQS
jgi:hypothetical protein